MTAICEVLQHRLIADGELLKLTIVDSIGCALLLMAVAFEVRGCYSSSSNLALKQ